MPRAPQRPLVGGTGQSASSLQAIEQYPSRSTGSFAPRRSGPVSVDLRRLWKQTAAEHSLSSRQYSPKAFPFAGAASVLEDGAEGAEL